MGLQKMKLTQLVESSKISLDMRKRKDSTTSSKVTNYSIVLLRHGESKANREGVWGGWLNSPLTDYGIQQARHAGRILKRKNYKFDAAYTSMLSRAQLTCDIVLEAVGQLGEIPVVKTYKLNETHCGDFTGRTMDEVFKKFGINAVRNLKMNNTKPPKITIENKHYHEIINMHEDTSLKDIPLAESPKDHRERIFLFWKNDVLPELKKGKRIIIVAHNGSLVYLVRCIGGKIDDKKLINGEFPNAVPFECNFKLSS